jgi:hypothetical protein
MGMLALPEKPVRPGDAWDTSTDLQMPISVPWFAGGESGGSSAVAHIRMSAAIHNKLMRVEAGRAVIETQVAAAAPHSEKVTLPPGVSLSFEKMEQSTTGTQQLNIEQGEIEHGNYVLKITHVVTMDLPSGTKVMTMGVPPDRGPKAAPATTVRSVHRKASTRSSAQKKESNPPAHRPGTTAVHAAAAPSGLKMAVDGTLKLKIERLTAESPPAPPPEK